MLIRDPAKGDSPYMFTPILGRHRCDSLDPAIDWGLNIGPPFHINIITLTLICGWEAI
jgi:hypothetical protein